MSQAEETFGFDMNRKVVITKKDGNRVAAIPFWLAVILIVGAPELVILVMLAMALDWITVSYEKCC